MRYPRAIDRFAKSGARAVLAIAASLFLAGCPAQESTESADASPTPPPRETIVLEGATVVDVRNGTLLHDMLLVLKDGQIKSMWPADTAAPPAEHGTRRIDARGKYVVPGYSDMHVHIMEQDHLGESLSLMLANGVTGFRQMSGTLDLLAQRKNGTLPIRPHHPELLGMPGAFLTPWNAPTPAAAVAQIDEQSKAGADFIKIGIVDAATLDAVLAEVRRVGIPALGHVPADVDPVAAAKWGIRSIEHLGPFDNILLDCANDVTLKRKPVVLPAALRIVPKIPFGKDLIDHVLPRILATRFLMTSPEEFERMRRIAGSFSELKCRNAAARLKEAGAWHVPTLTGLRSNLIPDDPRYTADEDLRYVEADSRKRRRSAVEKFDKKFAAGDKQTLKAMYAADLKLVKILDEAGVRMLTGTDTGPGEVGFGLHREFEELAKAGLTPLRILQMTTIDVAEFLGRTKTMGTVEPGQNADLVLLDANPLEDVQSLRKIDAVIRAGYYYSRQDLDKLEEGVADRVTAR